MSKRTPVKLDDLEEALLFLDAGSDTEARVCRDTGAVLQHGDECGEFDPLPADNRHHVGRERD